MSHKGCAEIIRVRLSDADYSAAVIDTFKQLKSTIATDSDGSLLIALHVNPNDKQDYSIHLYSERLEHHISRTVLGRCIAEFFAPLGLVNHSLCQET